MHLLGGFPTNSTAFPLHPSTGGKPPIIARLFFRLKHLMVDITLKLWYNLNIKEIFEKVQSIVLSIYK
jgi:hypothetical protein